MGGKSLHSAPVAMSLMASFVSSVVVLGKSPFSGT